MNLFIDFDGVILDTVHFYMDILNECQDLDEVARTNILKNLDWKIIIEEADEINNAISELKKLIQSNKFNISILTHVNSINEANEKKKFIEKNGLNIPVIYAFKYQNKGCVVDTSGSILVDDDIENIIDFEEHGGIGIYFSENTLKYPVKSIQNLGELLDYENIKS